MKHAALLRWLTPALSLLLLVTGCGQAHAAQADGNPDTDAILVLDASGSMWARMDGKPQITVAKQVILDLLDTLPPTTHLGLVAYGHRRKGDCADIETLVRVGDGRDAIRSAINGISPKGKTPMTAAVIQAAQDLKYTETKSTVILVTDGKETCNLDPCAAAAKLEKLGVDLTVHTIGFGMQEGSTGMAQARCMAEQTGGRFFAASNAEELATALEQVSQPQPPAKVEVALRATDQKGGPVIDKGLVWTVQADGRLAHEAGPGGSVTTMLAPGNYSVSVVRDSDGATATGMLEATAEGATLTLPLIAQAPPVLLVKLPCTAPGDRPEACATLDETRYESTLPGKPGKLYEVKLRISGIVEQRNYPAGESRDGMWQVGGPSGNSSDPYNTFLLKTSMPEAVYYLNAGPSGQFRVFDNTMTRTIMVQGGSALTLVARSVDGLEVRNQDGQGKPLSVPSVELDKQPYAGQFVQVEVVSSTPVDAPQR